MIEVDFTPIELTYSVVDEDIHQFYFLKASRKALDEWHQYLMALFPTISEDDRVLMILDITESGMQPMRYALRLAKQLEQKLGTLPATRYAFIYDRGVMLSLISSFFNILNLSNSDIQYFPTDKRADAIAWLREAETVRKRS